MPLFPDQIETFADEEAITRAVNSPSGIAKLILKLNAAVAAVMGRIGVIGDERLTMDYAGAPLQEVVATLTTSLAGANNDMVFTAVGYGADGNAVTIAYIDPAANGAALSVTVSGSAITVNLATNGGGAITSTAAEVKTAIDAYAAAAALVTCANAGADTGAGAVTALAATALSGGVDATGRNKAHFGALLVDSTNLNLHVNTGTKAEPVWEPLFSGSSGVAAIRNETGGTLAAGTPVYISGWSEAQNRFLVTKADADALGRRAQFFTQASMVTASNGIGSAAYRGTVNGTGSAPLDLAGAAVGDPVYLSTTAGECTLSAPSGGDDQVQIVGQVAIVASDIVEGIIRQPGVVGTNELADLAVTLGKIAANVLTGTVVGSVANANVVGGIPVLHQINIADAVSGDTDVVLTHKTRIIDAWVVLTAAGDAGNTYTVKNAGNAITDAITPGAADTTLKRAAQINDANHEIAAAGSLRVSHARIGGSSAAIVYVLGMRVA